MQSFTPILEDVGKEIGVPLNYNSASTKVWSELLCEQTGANLLCNASWSGSSMNSGQNGNYYSFSKLLTQMAVTFTATARGRGNHSIKVINTSRKMQMKFRGISASQKTVMNY